jgi:hypothetical protein
MKVAINNRIVAVITVLLILSSLLCGLQFVKVADANPIPWAFNPVMTITIQSPENGTISALPVFVSFTSQGDHQFSVSDDSTQDWVRSFFYVLDGQNMRTSGMRFVGTKTTEIHPADYVYSYNFSGQAYLTNLADGLHSITVYYGAVNNISYVGSPDELIYYNPSWQATSQFYVITENPSPTQSPNPTTNPSPTTTVPEFPSIMILSLLTTITLLTLLIYFKKQSRNKSP